MCGTELGVEKVVSGYGAKRVVASQTSHSPATFRGHSYVVRDEQNPCRYMLQLKLGEGRQHIYV